MKGRFWSAAEDLGDCRWTWWKNDERISYDDQFKCLKSAITLLNFRD